MQGLSIQGRSNVKAFWDWVLSLSLTPAAGNGFWGAGASAKPRETRDEPGAGQLWLAWGEDLGTLHREARRRGGWPDVARVAGGLNRNLEYVACQWGDV